MRIPWSVATILLMIGLCGCSESAPTMVLEVFSARGEAISAGFWGSEIRVDIDFGERPIVRIPVEDMLSVWEGELDGWVAIGLSDGMVEQIEAIPERWGYSDLVFRLTIDEDSIWGWVSYGNARLPETPVVEYYRHDVGALQLTSWGHSIGGVDLASVVYQTWLRSQSAG